MIICAFEVDKYPFNLGEEEEVLGLEFLYPSAIGAHIYLANSTRSDIALVVNLLARHNTTTCHTPKF
jgi:hypothetical protein